ncbi:MAG: hypothetical protein P8Y95_09730 [Gammaproteobacteria bacterium]
MNEDDAREGIALAADPPCRPPPGYLVDGKQVKHGITDDVAFIDVINRMEQKNADVLARLRRDLPHLFHNDRPAPDSPTGHVAPKIR